MNLKIRLTVLMLIVISASAKAQHYPQHYFSAPLDTPLILIGTFGEVRPDHFHSGIDFSTDLRDGKWVYASADGYVSRIKITNDGFGKALYVTHPNGFVTVYAHLQSFGNEIQHVVTAAQYEQKSYQVELSPKPNTLKVKKGEVIAFSGSTGDVDGPHLHFEIRDGVTEEPINPLLFGLNINDTIPPDISNIRVFPVPGQGIVNTTDTAATYFVMKTGDEYNVNSLDYIQAYGNIGFGIEATDAQPNSDAHLGIYSVELKVDSAVVYDFKMDRFNFDDKRYSNAHIDYLSKERDNMVVHRCFRLPGNHLKTLYSDTTKTGYVNFNQETVHNIEFTVRDYNGNKSSLKFPVITYTYLEQSNFQPIPTGALLVTPLKGVSIHKPEIDISIPAGAVYDSYQFLSSESSAFKGDLSPLYHVGDPFVPLHIPITVAIKPVSVPDSLKSKAVIVSINKYGERIYEGGTWNEKFLSAKVRHFGDFTVSLDTLAPNVVKEYYPADLNSSRGGTVQFRIADDLSGIKNYNITVDGKWVLTEYNKRERLLIGDIAQFLENKSHHIELTVTDEKGNEANFRDTFYY
jgi:hypothetical protein